MNASLLHEAPVKSVSSQPYMQRVCPSCDTSDLYSKPEVASATFAEQSSFEAVSQSWHGFFKEKIFFTYNRCQKCHLLFCPTFFTPESLIQLYGHMPDNTAGLPQAILSQTQHSYFETLKRYAPLKGNFLEIGADIGLFTRYCAQEGQFEKFYLYEPNQNVHASLAQKVRGKSFEIIAEMSNYSAIPNHSISTVAMIHVLDHLLDPKAELLKLREKMTPDGIILIVTHNEASLLAKITKTKWPPYCLQHPQLFRPQSMQRLLEATGFRVQTIEPAKNYFPVTYLAKHALSLVGLNQIPLPQWYTLTLGLKLGNIITVAHCA